MEEFVLFKKKHNKMGRVLRKKHVMHGKTFLLLLELLINVNERCH